MITITLRKKYFGNGGLPIVFYTDGDGGAEPFHKPDGRSCLICKLVKIKNIKSLYFNG
jgi:hypothetical protein